jgi:hypothetical protein
MISPTRVAISQEQMTDEDVVTETCRVRLRYLK